MGPHPCAFCMGGDDGADAFLLKLRLDDLEKFAYYFVVKVSKKKPEKLIPPKK